VSYYSRYDKGDWIADCDVCGRKYKASQLQKRWDGLMCCTQDWEIRQPQDFVRGVADTQVAPWTRPEPADQFIPVTLNAPIANFSVTSSCSLKVQFIEGPEVQRATSIVSAFLTWVRRFPILGGARQINGSPINTNTLN
jgi:hypothetical protein